LIAATSVSLRASGSIALSEEHGCAGAGRSGKFRTLGAAVQRTVVVVAPPAAQFPRLVVAVAVRSLLEPFAVLDGRQPADADLIWRAVATILSTCPFWCCMSLSV
jgi:hypothetical protein